MLGLSWKIFCIAALLSISACVFAQNENLVTNPGFENGTDARGIPNGGWWVYEGKGTGKVVVDSKVAHSGKASACLSSNEPVKWTIVSAPFKVSQGDELSFEAWVRAENARGTDKFITAGIAFRDKGKMVFDRQYVELESLGSSWTQLTRTVKVPAQAVTGEIHLNFRDGMGKVWLDDVKAVFINPISLTPVQEPAQYVGDQKIKYMITNRGADPFKGTLRAVVARKRTEVSVEVPAGSSREEAIGVELPRVGQHEYTVELSDSSGKIWHKLSGVFQARAPMSLYPASPCYHAVGEGDGTTRIDAEISLHPDRRNGSKLELTLLDSKGVKLSSATVDASRGNFAGESFKVPVDKVGDFEVQVRLLDLTGQEIAKGTADIHVRPAEDSRVLVGPDGYLRIGGKPHFSIGMYSCSRYDEMAAAGFSGVHSYQITTGDAWPLINPNEPRIKELLDNAYKNGMRLHLELPRKAIEEAKWEQVRHMIRTFRNHPGLLCWGSEERVARGACPLENILSLYRIVKEMDPNHPLVLGDTWKNAGQLTTDRRKFFPDDGMDIGIWWWYPIPLNSGDDGDPLQGGSNAKSLEPPSWLTTTLSKKPLWIAVQSYIKPQKDARFPTPTEYRCMSYLSIIHGVKGLWFYTGSGQRDYYGKSGGILNRMEEGHWDYVQKLVREIRELSPVIMGETVKGAVKQDKANSSVDFMVKRAGGKLYILAANRAGKECSVTFSSKELAGKKIAVPHENRVVSVKANSFTDSFGPYAVHVYAIEL